MDQERIEKLISELQNGTHRQRRAASYKLRKYKDVSAVQALIKVYHDPDASYQVENPIIDEKFIFGFTYLTAAQTPIPPTASP